MTIKEKEARKLRQARSITLYVIGGICVIMHFLFLWANTPGLFFTNGAGIPASADPLAATSYFTIGLGLIGGNMFLDRKKPEPVEDDQG